MLKLNAAGLYYKDLNERIKAAVQGGERELLIQNLNGHRYVGTGISGEAALSLEGTPGNDLAAYLDGPEIIVRGNAQDGVGNTMNRGRVIIHGSAGDVTGYAMRGGEIFIRDNVGYRVGIHMKSYQDLIPIIVIGGSAGDFFGEYMAGGVMILLGLGREPGQELTGNYCGTGMHGGVIYLRGEVEPHKLGKEVRVENLEPAEQDFIAGYVNRFAAYFGFDAGEIMARPFQKLIPYNKRPYGNLYVNNL